jgi:hypothetical protein
MPFPDTPRKWAIHLSKILEVYHTAHPETDRFPIDVSKIAKEYSAQVFPGKPITLIKGSDLSDKFEGALIPHPNKNEWAILYNNKIPSRGRINFTLAHELGHYLLHLPTLPNDVHCSPQTMNDWNSKEAQIETDANIFASHLLMPSEDFCKQMYNKKISYDLIVNLAHRYGVSITAAALKWIDLCNIPAMIVYGRDGFIDWSWSNKDLMKMGIYYPAKQKTIEYPSGSLANIGITGSAAFHEENVWPGNKKTTEILLQKSDEFSLSLVIYRSNSISHNDKDEEDEEILKELDGSLSF